jgi:hypothetical protein
MIVNDKYIFDDHLMNYQKLYKVLKQIKKRNSYIFWRSNESFCHNISNFILYMHPLIQFYLLL